MTIGAGGCRTPNFVQPPLVVSTPKIPIRNWCLVKSLTTIWEPTRLTRGAGPALAWFQNTPETLIRNIQNYHWWVILSSVVAAPIQNQKKLDPLLRNIFENILVKKKISKFSNFSMMIFFFEIFWNFKIFEIGKFSKFQVRKKIFWLDPVSWSCRPNYPRGSKTYLGHG